MKLQNMFKKIKKTGSSQKEKKPEVPQGLIRILSLSINWNSD